MIDHKSTLIQISISLWTNT